MALLDLFNMKYPSTDFHELNLDWCISAILQLQKYMEEFTAGNKLIFADPLQHDLTKTYAKNTIVLDDDGNAYLSLDTVPKGVQLSNAAYWLMVFNFEDYTEKANKNFTDNYFRDTTRAPYALEVDDWVVLDDVLYKVIVDIPADDLFEIGVNITHFTIEQFLKDFVASVNQTLTNWYNQMTGTINQYKNDIDASELAYRNQLAQDIADTTAVLSAQLAAAIAGVTVDSEVIDARVGANGITYPTLGEAIRSQIGILNDITTHFYKPTLTWVDNYFVNTAGAIISSSAYAYTKVTLGKALAVIIRSDFMSDAVGLAFYKSDDSFISAWNNKTGISAFTEFIKVPDEADYVQFSCLKNEKSNAYIIATIREDLDSVFDMISNNKALLENTEYMNFSADKGFYSTTDKLFHADSNWRSVVLKLNPEEELYITANVVGNAPVAMYYYDLPISANNYIDKQGDSGSYTDLKLVPPANSRYVALTNHYSVSPFFGIKRKSVCHPAQKGLMAIKIENNTVSFKPTKHDADNDVLINMKHTGGNSLFDIYNIGLVENKSDIVNTNFEADTLCFTNPTDWLGPLCVAAVNNIDGDNPTSEYFTGGNHRSNNSGIGGVITAEENDLKFYVDGNLVTSFEGYASSLRIEWNNSLQAYNTTKNDGTGRYVLKQYYTLEADTSGKIDITIKLIPDEDVILQKYYGFAIYCDTGTEYSYPGTDTNRYTYTIGTDIVNSGDLHAVEVSAHNIIDLRLAINNAIDLGRLDHIGTASYNYFTTAAKKLYPMVVYEDVPMNEDEEFYLKGSYILK